MNPPLRQGDLLVFSESHRTPWWMRIVGVVAMVAALTIVAAMVIAPPRSLLPELFEVIGGICAFGAGFVLMFSRTELTIRAGVASFALWPVWRVTIPIGDVADARLCSMSSAQFGGLGLRVLPDRRRALLLSNGPGVTFVRTSTQVTYFIRTDSASALLSALVE